MCVCIDDVIMFQTQRLCRDQSFLIPVPNNAAVIRHRQILNKIVLALH